MSPISLIAWSQLIFCHLPPTSFIGYFSRRSPWACSRTEAPFAQCEPRLKGLSKAGSWPIQTPFWTSARTEQPTEQCVQTDLMMSTLPAAAAGFAACALVTVPADRADAAARPPAAKPERRRKVRRSMALPVSPVSAFERRGPLAIPFVLLVSMTYPFP